MQLCCTGSSGNPKRKTLDLQELILATFPLQLSLIGIGVMTILILDPIRLQFSYHLLPEEYQNNSILVSLITLEFFLFNIEFAGLSFVVVFQIAFFRFCLQKLSMYVRHAHAFLSFETMNFMGLFVTCSGIREVNPTKSYRDLRELQLLITMFNCNQSEMIYLLKIFLVSNATVMGFFGIRYFHSNPFLGLFGLAIALINIALFLALYDNAFAIPINVLNVKMKAIVNWQLFNGSTETKSNGLRRALESVPVLGIRVGGFCFLERESTPIFMDYVTNRIGGLLVTF